MAERSYPKERKAAGLWQCPFCKKQIGVRGKNGHLKLFHAQSLLLRQNDPFPFVEREIIPKKRPLARADVRNLLENIHYLISLNRPKDFLAKRKIYLKCEFLIRELEINFNCTLEDALNKFPELRIRKYGFRS